MSGVALSIALVGASPGLVAGAGVVCASANPVDKSRIRRRENKLVHGVSSGSFFLMALELGHGLVRSFLSCSIGERSNVFANLFGAGFEKIRGREASGQYTEAGEPCRTRRHASYGACSSSRSINAHELTDMAASASSICPPQGWPPASFASGTAQDATLISSPS